MSIPVSARAATRPLADPTGIRPAQAADLPALAALALRSKAHWGYDAAFMEACREELALTEGDLAGSDVAVIDGLEGQPVAMAQVVMEGDRASLHKLFIDPGHMGRGLGRAMMIWATETARAKGAKEMEIESDPDAAPFYARLGAIPAGTAPSGSIPGRVLPRFLLPL